MIKLSHLPSNMRYRKTEHNRPVKAVGYNMKETV